MLPNTSRFNIHYICSICRYQTLFFFFLFDEREIETSGLSFLVQLLGPLKDDISGDLVLRELFFLSELLHSQWSKGDSGGYLESQGSPFQEV